MRTYKRVLLGSRKGAIMLGGQKFDGQANNPLLNNMSKKQIEDSINNFMSGDSKFNGAVRKHLFQRLKYATGTLMESIVWKTKVSVAGQYNNFSVKIGVYLTDPELIDALLSGGELEKHGSQKIPSVEDLVRYVEGKRSYYIDMIRDRYKPMLHQNRQNLKPKRMDDFRGEPINQIAEEIRNSMIARKSKQGKSPTKGSEYTLVGWWNIKGSNGNNWWQPKYKKWDTPLYTIDSDKGEINQAIKECIQRYFDKMFDPHFGEAIAEQIKDASMEEMLEHILPEIIQDKKYNNLLHETTQKIFDLVDTVQSRVKKEGQYSHVFIDLYKKQAQTQNIRIDRMSTNFATQDKIDRATKNMISEIDKYVIRYRKRHAKRRRGA